MISPSADLAVSLMVAKMLLERTGDVLPGGQCTAEQRDELVLTLETCAALARQAPVIVEG